jgi:hypothetical protein
MTTPSFRNSSVVAQQVQQADGRHEIVAIQVNVVPVSAVDEGSMDVVAGAAIGLFNENVSALRYAADQLEAQQH